MVDTIYLVRTPGGSGEAKRQLRAFLTRRLDTLAIPLVYKFGGEGRSLAVIIPSAALADG